MSTAGHGTGRRRGASAAPGGSAGAYRACNSARSGGEPPCDPAGRAPLYHGPGAGGATQPAVGRAQGAPGRRRAPSNAQAACRGASAPRARIACAAPRSCRCNLSPHLGGASTMRITPRMQELLRTVRYAIFGGLALVGSICGASAHESAGLQRKLPHMSPADARFYGIDSLRSCPVR